jgi:hypothetical protein
MKINEGIVESEGHCLGYLAVNEHLLNQSDEPVIVFIKIAVKPRLFRARM